MRSAEGTLTLPPRKRRLLAVLGAAASSPRLWTYIGCAGLALLASCLLGKDMNWDTLDYHFYAGFSALHDRFGLDYFPAGSQSYFNPYVYVPFYLLASSGLPAIVVASVLAIVQSGILWLTYELALQVAPPQDRRGRVAIAICSASFALANPILLNLFGSSYADVITAEMVLAGWLLLLLAVRSPGVTGVIAAGVLLGAASALKLTNSVHALAAGVLLLFIPARWPSRIRYLTAFGAATAVSCVLVCLPWSLRLEQHFGNPLFPLLNGIFRSPQFPSAPMLDYRFIPSSLAEFLLRPFAIAKPVFKVDDESQAPDVRYAALLCAAILVLARWAWRTYRRSGSESAPDPRVDAGAGTRALAALGAGFAVDWVLWLTASGNGRYFIAMACVAGVLAIALIRRLFDTSRIGTYLLALLLGAQFVQLGMGTIYRSHISWGGRRPWFDVRLPADLPRAPTLYLSYGVQSNAFIVPFLPPGSGFVNIAGDYPLAGSGANGAAVAALIHRYWPRVRVLARDARAQEKRLPVVSGMAAAADALLPFGLSRAGDCLTIVIPDEGSQELMFQHTEFKGKSPPSRAIPDREIPESPTGYLTTCAVAPNPVAHTAPTVAERNANLALDRLEDACPRLFQPARPVTQYYGDARQDIWARRYLNTSLTAWVTRGWVEFIDPIRGGAATYIGPESAFEREGMQIVCGRRNERYFATVVSSAAPGSGR
jgi:hypothetical protein